MKIWRRKEMKKHPYKKTRPMFKGNIFAQIKAREKRIKEKLPNYAIVDEKGNIIEKYRLKCAVDNDLHKVQKNYYERLRVVTLDNEGNVPK